MNKITKNNLAKASSVLFFLNILACVFNYLCQLLMARVLSIESYGTINTIFSFMMIVAVPGVTLTMIVAKHLAEENFNKEIYLKRQLRVVFSLTIIVMIILTIGYQIFSNLLLISNLYILFMAFILAALGYFQPLFSGVFSGSKRFILVGIYSLCIPVYKLIAIGLAYICSKDDLVRLYTVLGTMIVGVIATAIYGHVRSKRIVRSGNINNTAIPAKLYGREDINALVLNISLMLYMNIDLLTVRYYGDETESGLYSAVLLFGRVIYYFATTLGTILLPTVASDKNRKSRQNTLNMTLLLMVVFALLCIVPINIFKKQIILILYGTEYLLASKYVLFVCIISLSLSIYTILVNYVVGIGESKISTIIMIVVDMLLLLSIVFGTKINIILLNISVIGMIGAVAIYLVAYKSGRNEN